MMHGVGRRRFLAGAAAASVGFGLGRAWGQGEPVPKSDHPPVIDREALSATLDKVLVAGSPELHALAVDAYAQCILGKIRPAQPPFNHAWIVPGGGYFAQWIWDTMFVADLLAVLPGQEEVIRGVFQNYWDFQARWNRVKPEFMHGFIPNFMAPYYHFGNRDGRTWPTFPAFSQAPLLAWGMERVFLRNGDKELLRNGLAGLESFHEWYWRERDFMDVGVIGVGSYDGVTQNARYETYDHEFDLDGLKMIAHPFRSAGPENGAWYGDIAIPANTAYLLRSEQALARMATTMGDRAMAARRMARHAKGAAALKNFMWDEAAGCFLAVNVMTMDKIPTPSVGSFMPLMAGVPTQAQADAMARALTGPAWNTPLPIPTLPATDKAYSSGKYWRGDAWPAPDYQVASGLAAYGHKEDAARITDTWVANTLKVGISERYDSVTGATLGVPGLGMSATCITMMLDGLTGAKYKMAVRKHVLPDGRPVRAAAVRTPS
jgi:glycogen debranching enzyme